MVRSLNRLWDEAYRPTGLSAPHAYLIRLIDEQPGITQKQAGEYLHLEKSTITRFVDALEKKGLILRYEGDTARETQLQLSTAGKKLAVELNAIGQQLYRTMRRKLGNEQFDEIVNDMRSGLQALSM